MGPINNIPALVQIMAWPRICDKLLSELMLITLLTHICVTQSQWVVDNYQLNGYLQKENILSLNFNSSLFQTVILIHHNTQLGPIKTMIKLS